jgi:hypothetical protein
MAVWRRRGSPGYAGGMERRPDPMPAPIDALDPQFRAARGIVATRATGDGVEVDMADPADADAVAAIAFALRRPVTAVAADASPVAPVASVVPVRASLAGRVARGFGGTGVARWVALDAVAQLVAQGAGMAEAVARVRPGAAGAAALLDGLAAGRPAADWLPSVAGREATMLRLAAARMRFEVARGIAIRRAGLAPGLVLIAGLVLLGPWGLLPAILLPAARGALRPLSVARRTGRAVAVRILTGQGMVPVDGLTPAECDALDETPEAVMHAVDARALLAVEGAGAALGLPMLALLGVLAVVRLD